MALLIITVIIILILELPCLIKNQMKRELAVFSAILIIGAVYGIFHIFQLHYLNPTNITQSIFKPLFDTIDGLLK